MADGDDILQTLQDVQKLPPGVHWFCPRESSADEGFYLDEDAIIQGSQPDPVRVQRAQAREDLVISSFRIFAFDGEQAEAPQQWLEQRFSAQLSVCDVCVRQFHRARRKLKEQLMHEYDEDQVAAFMHKFDTINVQRVERSLADAAEQLQKAPAQKRGIGALDNRGIHAVLEALSCKPFLSSVEELDRHFISFFNVLQTNKTLKLGSYSPALTWFLFGHDKELRKWAAKEWKRLKRGLLPIQFEHCVQDPLLIAMSRVQIDNLEKEFLQQFWDGVYLITSRMSRDLITHSLRALDGKGMLESDVCRLAFGHLQVDSEGFISLLGTMHHILTESPTDFWDALGTVSPNSWLEQFFASPALERIVRSAANLEEESGILGALFGWMYPFFLSIRPANRAQPVATALSTLLEKFQGDAYSPRLHSTSAEVAIKCLALTLRELGSSKSKKELTTPIVDLALTAAERHMRQIWPYARKTAANPEHAVEAISQAIHLDCQSFLANALDSSSPRPTHTAIWGLGGMGIDYGNIKLATRLLTVLKVIGGSEHVVIKSTAPPEHHVNINKGMDKLAMLTRELLERISYFSAPDIEVIFDDANASYGFFMLLFSFDKELRAAATELLKGATAKTTRREAIVQLLETRPSCVLNALTNALKTLAQAKKFVTCSSTLKVLENVLDALCNQQDGILRTSGLTAETSQAIENFWHAMWTLLKAMFSTTETWSIMGHDKNVLMDFCREAMDFADQAFDQFAVLKGSLTHEQSDLGRHLLEAPTAATSGIINWLKLRDDFLVSKSSALVCKLLKRLKEFGEMLNDDSIAFIYKIIMGNLKSTLTPNMKAELSRALEIHSGIKTDEISSKEGTPVPGKKLKAGVIDIEQWTSSAKKPTQLTDDEVLAQATPARELLKARQAAQPEARTSVLKLPPRNQGPVNVSAFKQKREQEMAERKRRDALIAAQQKKRLEPISLAGAGSGVRGIGVAGRLHVAEEKGESMMVSSSEESDEEITEMDRELFGLGSPKSRKALPTLTREQELALKQRQKPVKKTRVVRSTRDMKARLAPDLSSLHLRLLAWEYFYDGAFPPGSHASNYNAVSKSFRDPVSYQSTFESLLLLETWQGFLKGKEEMSSRPYEIEVTSRSSVDSFIEVSSTMSHTDAKDVSEGDIVLLSKAKSPASAQDESHALSRISRIARKKAVVEVTYRSLPGTSLAPSLALKARLYGLKIMSVIPMEREYGALQGLQYYDLCEEITSARPSPILRYNDDTLQKLMDNYKVNKAQAYAVKSAIDNDAFTLIQGPPGSGKTKTIVAIAGALLSESLKYTGTAISQPRATNAAGSTVTTKKILVCAPSNAAVDELVMRFKEGVKTLSGDVRKLSIVRLGRSDAINTNVQDVTLDELVNKKLNTIQTSNASADTHKLMMEHKDVSERLRSARENLDALEGQGTAIPKELKEDFDGLKRQKALLGSKIDSAKDSEGAQNRQADYNRRRAQQEVLESAHVICATLSGSGHDMFQTLSIEFETVIIDEAAQCVELSALIPLKYGCAKCILVGDPQQLPPTVFSKDAARFNYEQSLFVRMQGNHPKDVHLLDTQYRMHPEISAFPSQAFYDSRLIDGKDMALLRAKPWHSTALLTPYRFFDVQGQQQSAPKGHSLVNLAEVRIAMQLYRRLTADFATYDFSRKIGIITPYKSQLRELKDQFRARYGQGITETIEFNTTDAFQGRESEIIIFSCVRASPAGGIGFLSDIRRMNVGLTRAKSSLWVLGNSQSLMKGEYWAKLIEHSRKTGRYTDGDLDKLLRASSKAVEPMEVDAADRRPTQDVEMADVSDSPASDRARVNGKRHSVTHANGKEKALTDTYGNHAAKRKLSPPADPRLKHRAKHSHAANGQGIAPPVAPPRHVGPGAPQHQPMHLSNADGNKRSPLDLSRLPPQQPNPGAPAKANTASYSGPNAPSSTQGPQANQPLGSGFGAPLQADAIKRKRHRERDSGIFIKKKPKPG